MAPSDLTYLHNFLVEHFDGEELKTLCFELRVDYDSLPGQGKAAKARDLILQIEQQGELGQLLAALKRRRPNLFDRAGLSTDPAVVKALYDELPAYKAQFSPSWWDRFRQRPQVFYPALALAVVMVLIILLAGLVSIGADIGGASQQLREWGILPTLTPTPFPTSTPEPPPTPLPFNTAGPDEILIVVATFHRTEGVMDTDAANEIRRAIQQAAQELQFSQIRVEIEPAHLTADDQQGAKMLGERYGASMVIWGADTGVRVTVSFLNMKKPDFEAATIKISETKRTQLANPKRSLNPFSRTDYFLAC